MMHSIETVSGRWVDLASPQVESIRVDDMIWSLSCQVRYVGHTMYPSFTIAQHSVMVWRAVKEYLQKRQKRCSALVQLRALFHDAHEAYIGDISHPMKQLLELKQPLRRLADRFDAVIWKAIAKEVNVEIGLLTEQVSIDALEAIKTIDQWMRIYEQNYLQRSGSRQVAEALEEGGEKAEWLTVKLASSEPFFVMPQAQAHGSMLAAYSYLVEQVKKR